MKRLDGYSDPTSTLKNCFEIVALGVLGVLVVRVSG
jgi:hypothetical protein